MIQRTVEAMTQGTAETVTTEQIPIWKYKEFWTLIITQIVAAATFFGGRCLTPDDMAIVYWAVGMLETTGAFFIAVFATQRLHTEARATRVGIDGLALLTSSIVNSQRKEH